MTVNVSSLSDLGWSHFFQQQLSLEEWETCHPVRVFALNRHLIDGYGAAGRLQCALPPAWLQLGAEQLPTVGDWLMLDQEARPVRLLERKSLFKRMASGRETKVQLMAANVDTLFIVTSCNRDFNLSRLERYLALALDAGVDPVVLLTKADLTDEIDAYCDAARTLRPELMVVALNAKASNTPEMLRSWLDPGRTVALVGSSGVGKSTLVNTLSGNLVQETGTIRDSDAKGRHTTTARSLHLVPGGGLLIDSPGLRELQLNSCETGVATLFEEIERHAGDCRFKDCRHQGEAGCAVAAAANRGDIEPRRLANYLKLRAEQERIAETLVEKRRREKSLSKLYKRVQTLQRSEKQS